MARVSTVPVLHRPSLSQASVEENMFADLKTNRGSGSSNTTKTASTDTSSRHSNVSTAPSSADLGHQGPQEEWAGSSKRAHGNMAGSVVPKPPSRGFLERAGRTFSFGGQKKGTPSVPSVEDHPLPSTPPTPNAQEQGDESGRRPRGLTSSTTSTATPPKLDDENDFSLDMGSDFGQMFDNKFKRNSAMTLRALAREDAPKEMSAPRSLTGNRHGQSAPAPIQIDQTTKVEPSPHSWNSHQSHDQLLDAKAGGNSPSPDEQPPPVPRHASPLSFTPSNRPSDIMEDEDDNLLKDSLVASRLLGDSNQLSVPTSRTAPNSGRFRRNENPRGWGADAPSKGPTDENMFEGGLAHSSRVANRYVSRAPSPPRNKVMTPAQFERYRQDVERKGSTSDTGRSSIDDHNDDEDNYDDDEDEVEKAKQAAKQRRKQEAHMTVYRQQMMKVTGESNNQFNSPHPGLQPSMSTPNLMTLPPQLGPINHKADEEEEEDEEIPLAILAAHGFPNKNKPPNRIGNMASNPDLRASMLQPPNRPGSSMGNSPSSQAAGNRASQLPAFARRLPQDPFLGAGLVNGPPRESMNFSGGLPTGQGPLPPGGLVGVIANEERSRALRRGSPQIDTNNFSPSMNNGPGGFDPVVGIPPQMMYGMQPPQMMLTPGDQAQIQMTQQMQQFMQMQMQFMQMMAGNGSPQMGGPQMGSPQMGGPPMMSPQMGARPMSQMPTSMTPDLTSRQSYFGDAMLPGQEPLHPGFDPRMRTMSMVQPSSDSWIQPGPVGGYTPSIRAQGMGYAPSIAPSERSNIGLPGRYRPVSQAASRPVQDQVSMQDFPAARRTSTLPSVLDGWDQQPSIKPVGKTPSPPAPRAVSPIKPNNDDDDDEKGWEAMKAKREKKRSLWKSKKTFDSDIGALIS